MSVTDPMPSQRGHMPPRRLKVAFFACVLPAPRSTVIAPLARTVGTLKEYAFGGPMCGSPSLLNRIRSIALASVAVPTVERGLAPIRSWSTMIAVVRPSRTSTSGRANVGMNPCTNALYVSLISRCDSAAIVSKTSELFPEPETPVNTVSRRFGISIEMSLRLFSRAPCTRITPCLSATCCAVARELFALVALIRIAGSAHSLLQERADLLLLRRSELLQCVIRWPHVTVVQLRFITEPDGRVPLVELRRGFEEADVLTFAVGVSRHAVPGLRREVRRTGLDDRVELLRHRLVRSRHRVDRVQASLCEVGLLRFRLQLLRARPHRGAFFGAELAIRLAGGLLRALLRSLPCSHLRSSSMARQRSSWIRTRFPAGSRTAQSRVPHACSIGSCTISMSLAWTFSNVASRSGVASMIQP